MKEVEKKLCPKENISFWEVFPYRLRWSTVIHLHLWLLLFNTRVCEKKGKPQVDRQCKGVTLGRTLSWLHLGHTWEHFRQRFHPDEEQLSRLIIRCMESCHSLSILGKQPPTKKKIKPTHQFHRFGTFTVNLQEVFGKKGVKYSKKQ